MKKRVFLYMSCLCIMAGVITACSENNDRVINGADGITVQTRIGTKAVPDGYNCEMYVFKWNAGAGDYLFRQTLPLVTGDNLFDVLESDYDGRDFRFYFLAQPAGDPGIVLRTGDDLPLTVNYPWNNLVVTATRPDLSENYYHKIIDKAGNDLMNELVLHADLENLIGQVVLDIFRTDVGVNNPVDISTTDVLSVLDRVYAIELEYSGMARTGTFNGNMEIEPLNKWEQPVIQSIENIVQDNEYRVSIPQADKNLITFNNGPVGSVRIQGLNFLPVDDIRVKVTFKYYDTTPFCGDPAHNHDVSCYDARTLVLNLPARNESVNLMTVLSNHFTVNKAGIRFDRIIDLDQPYSAPIDISWNNTIN